ncbi:MAG: exodeoxyribonuclease III [Spirochaetaceae bacterium]|nr:exodeoxyribonuclease III [Spirochaetaceae bacterium]
MRIATWNVNGVRARLQYILRWLAARKPDLVGLQKIRVPDGEFPTREFGSAGYHATAYCHKGEYGVGILSRRKPTVVRKGLPGQDDLGARLLTVAVDGLELSSVYAPYGDVEGRARKLAWLKSLREHLAATPPGSARRVLCGDFNVVPEDRDTSTGARNPNALNFTDEERSELSALLDAGFVDLYAHLHPDGHDRFTFWNYRWNRDTLRYGVRLDLILGTRRVVDRVRDVRVDMDYRKSIDGLLPSECAPVIADLDD